ncbi:MAG TPA: signal peptidase I [Verrucomicrobiae bacterium]|jgi:signal peptidase I|nr:signal peptidase I [Verrucomicrobiae bacterium]
METAPTPSGSRGEWLRLLKIFAVGRRPKRTLARIIVLAVTCYLVFGFALLPVRVTGISMEPTYHNGSINFSNRLVFLWREPRRGDVVTIRYGGIHVMLMKRVIGLPGETVAFVHGRVFINGNLLEEPYMKERSHWNVPAVKLGADDYFVVGDNRTMRWQDHEFGKVSRERIIGKALL